MSSEPQILLPSYSMEFNAEAWNALAGLGNCFSYALNCPKLGPREPGNLVWSNPPVLCVNEMVPLNIVRFREHLQLRDKLIPITEEEAMSGKFHAIAVDLSAISFHCRRRNRNGIWAGKEGPSIVSEFDENGRPVENPRLQPTYFG